jgi:hypothetical protein
VIFAGQDVVNLLIQLRLQQIDILDWLIACSVLGMSVIYKQGDIGPSGSGKCEGKSHSLKI